MPVVKTEAPKRGQGQGDFTPVVPPRDVVHTDDEVCVCIDKEVPAELVPLSMELAIIENADNIPLIRFGTQFSPAQMAMLAGKKWQIGRTLYCYFMNGEQAVQEKVFSIAQQWEKFANLRLALTTDVSKAQIRIAFNKGQGSWSYIGTDCLTIAKSEPTMNLGWLTTDSKEQEYSRVVLHEFGHALGCIHEHQHPEAGIPWNKEAVYKFYMATPNNWTKSDVDNNLFRRYDKSITQYSEYDKNSIMSYAVPANLTNNGFSIGWNTSLSDTDKKFVGQMYPFPANQNQDVFINKVYKLLTKEEISEDQLKSYSGHGRAEVIENIIYSYSGLTVLFEDILGKQLSASANFNDIKQQIDRKITEEQIVAQIVSGVEDQNFIAYFYELLVGKKPSEDELSQSLLNLKISSKYQVVLNFLQDKKYRNNQVEKYYVRYLQRNPSASELNAWVSSSADLAKIRLSILCSEEFYQKP